MDESTRIKPERHLTRQAFDQLLAGLASDRNRAGEEYESIRRKLVRFFECRGCLFSEDYTDETINRVARKIAEGEVLHHPSSYFYGVARRVLPESLRVQAHDRALSEAVRNSPSPGEAADTGRLRCLRRCMETLAEENRTLLIRYYEGEKRVKIENRRKLAARSGSPLNALRIRACRIRKDVRACVEGCLQSGN
ncbi:MAG: hypothetical protein HY650_16425 [Acidobacteria bacterium]|nr:hypothetical protein [Acidobacteriota bacterium]